MQFAPLVLSRNRTRRECYLATMQAALDAVDPYAAVRARLRCDGDTLYAGDRAYALDRISRILVIGAGKAGAPMVRAVEDVLGDRIASGLVVVKTGHSAPTRCVELIEAGHPIPNKVGFDAGRRILAMAESAGAGDLVIALISGGGSALLEAPAGITLAELQTMTDSLLACGATINEVNCLRKHISLVKGGQLARAVAPAALLTLVLSDVVGSPLDVIASGPTVPDSTTWDDAWAVVERYRLLERLPASIIVRLQAGREGRLADTPKPGNPLFDGAATIIVGDNRVAALAACDHARAAGYHSMLLTTFAEGEAREVAKIAAAIAREVRVGGSPVAAPACIVLGGETTVTLTAQPGKGGRNQELALAAAIALDGIAGVTVASLATDGSDGPTDSAGGIVDGDTLGIGRALGLDATAALCEHNAYPYLQATGALLLTGPTQTNVNDLIFAWVEPEP